MHRFLMRAAAPLLLAAALSACGTRTADTTAPPGSDWASIAKLPDFGGWWEWQFTEEHQPKGPDGKPQGLPQMMIRAAIKPEIMQTILGTIAKLEDTSTAEREELFGADTVCLPPFFLGLNGGPFHQFEILLTPGRATIADEMHLVRRVAIGQVLPAEVEESNAATSVGHWEGDTLVIETTGINSERFVFPPFKVGKGVHITERFRLAEPDLLEITLEMTAPSFLTTPFKDTFLYRRNRDHVFTDANVCSENDRSIDHQQRRQRFDLTPPPDLPPPPVD